MQLLRLRGALYPEASKWRIHRLLPRQSIEAIVRTIQGKASLGPREELCLSWSWFDRFNRNSPTKSKRRFVDKSSDRKGPQRQWRNAGIWLWSRPATRTSQSTRKTRPNDQQHDRMPGERRLGEKLHRARWLLATLYGYYVPDHQTNTALHTTQLHLCRK